MAQDKRQVDAITARDVDFTQWYTDVCKKAELIDYTSVKGMFIYRPYGYAGTTDAMDCCTTMLCLNCLCGGGHC